MIAKGGVITKGAEKKFTDKQVKDMSIKCREIGQNVGDLSGGNKQKVVFGKWLGNEAEIYILDCPTRGIDIGVKAFMYQLMYRLKKEGKSILMISEELPELIGMSDRILIMKDGQIQDSFTRSEELNESVLIRRWFRRIKVKEKAKAKEILQKINSFPWNHFNDYHISGRRRRETADKR